MAPVDSINSQISFGRMNWKKPDIKGYGGGKTFEQKYGSDINITTANAQPLILDYAVDHAIEFGVTALMFTAALLKGKKIMSGVSGAFVDSAQTMAKKQDNLGLVKATKAYISTLTANIQKTKETQKAANVIDGVKSEQTANKAKKVLEGSVIDKISQKADDETTLVSKLANSKTGKRIVLGKENALGDKAVTSKDMNKFFATKLGFTRGADVVDTVAATGGAAGAAYAANVVSDAGTDINDDEVATKARRKAERIKGIQTLYNAL